MAVTTGSVTKGTVSQANKTQVCEFSGYSSNFSGWPYYWSYIAVQLASGGTTYEGPYNIITGVVGYENEYPGIGNYTHEFDGATWGVYKSQASNWIPECDRDYRFKAGHGGGDGSTPDAYREASYVYFKTDAIDVTAPTLSSSSVSYTTATITCSAWYANTYASTATAKLQYKAQSDSTWTDAGADTGAQSGYSAQSSFSRNLTGLTEGTTYQYRLYITRTTENGTTYTSSESTFTTLTATPTVTTSAATSVTSDSATLNGSVDPNTSDVAPYFQLGTSTGTYNILTGVEAGHFAGPGLTCASLGHTSSADPVSMTQAVTGLTASTTYYYRAVASILHGTGDEAAYVGNEQTFTTDAPPPTPECATAAASSVGGTTAQLNGTVHPHSISSTYDFEWDTDSGAPYANNTADQGPSSSSTQFSYNQGLTGLGYSTTYYYRARVYDNVGATYYYGSEVSFTTGADPGVALIAAAAAEDHVRTVEFDAWVGIATQVTFVLFSPRDSSGDSKNFYTGTPPEAGDCFLFKDGAAASWATTAPAITQVGTYLYKMTIPAADLSTGLVDVVIQDQTATKAFRSLHLQIHTKRSIGQLDVDSTTFGSNANAVNLTAHGTGYSLNLADDLYTAETLTIGGNLAIGGDLDIAGKLDVVGNIETDAALAVGTDLTVADDITLDVLSAASIIGPLASQVLGYGTVTSASGYSVVLDATTGSSLAGAYIRGVLGIVSGTGEGQYRLIESYDATNKTVTINRSWSTVPNATSGYAIWPATDAWDFGPIVELAALPTATATSWSGYGDLIQWLLQRFFYAREQRETGGATALTFKMFKDDGSTSHGTAAVTDAGGTGGTHTIAKMS